MQGPLTCICWICHNWSIGPKTATVSDVTTKWRWLSQAIGFTWWTRVRNSTYLGNCKISRDQTRRKFFTFPASSWVSHSNWSWKSSVSKTVNTKEQRMTTMKWSTALLQILHSLQPHHPALPHCCARHFCGDLVAHWDKLQKCHDLGFTKGGYGFLWSDLL